MADILQMALKIHVFIWELRYFDLNFTEICSQGSNKQYGSIGSDNGLVLNWRQAIIWTNDGLVYWCIHASLSLNELMT